MTAANVKASKIFSCANSDSRKGGAKYGYFKVREKRLPKIATKKGQ